MWRQTIAGRTYVTFKLRACETCPVEYVGRTSGLDGVLDSILYRRWVGHQHRDLEFIEIDRWATGGRGAQWAIRDREQQLMDYYGGRRVTIQGHRFAMLFGVLLIVTSSDVTTGEPLTVGSAGSVATKGPHVEGVRMKQELGAIFSFVQEANRIAQELHSPGGADPDEFMLQEEKSSETVIRKLIEKKDARGLRDFYSDYVGGFCDLDFSTREEIRARLKKYLASIFSNQNKTQRNWASPS